MGGMVEDETDSQIMMYVGWIVLLFFRSLEYGILRVAVSSYGICIM